MILVYNIKYVYFVINDQTNKGKLRNIIKLDRFRYRYFIHIDIQIDYIRNAYMTSSRRFERLAERESGSQAGTVAIKSGNFLIHIF